MAYVTEKRGVHYAVIYEGRNPSPGPNAAAGIAAITGPMPSGSPPSSPPPVTARPEADRR